MAKILLDCYWWQEIVKGETSDNFQIVGGEEQLFKKISNKEILPRNEPLVERLPRNWQTQRLLPQKQAINNRLLKSIAFYMHFKIHLHTCNNFATIERQRERADLIYSDF
ncbi:hypothetical protein O6H91_05G025300 [Diphasiastrum complanatum]|uniref:Uncharacterized protein n=1 Tax=Diphasiastrum complanatum TaxID=34168 RepID=A0ACC2DLN5_DIPCM|nr:hypothetical protein O6H91_05G025300 [Diphasiastrum complanatum]